MSSAQKIALGTPPAERARRLRPVVGRLRDGTAHYAPVGAVVVDGDHVLCHLCGFWYRSVLAHLRQHGWDQGRYRAAFGLERAQSLEGAATRRRRAEAFIRRRRRDPAVQAGCAVGRRWAVSGELTRAASRAARGRRQPEQRRRKTLATLAAIPPQARAQGARRHADARLRRTAEAAARALGFPDIGTLVRDRIARGASLAAISREAGLHKDWLCRHLRTVDPATAAVAATRLTTPEDARWLEVVARFGFTDVSSYLSDRHLVRRRTAAAIAREVGVTSGAVRSALRRHGIALTPHATSRARLGAREAAIAARFGFPDLDGYLADRRAAGLSWRAIAAESGQPATWIRRRAGR
ncbi:MucR family transcriptional regulator [Pseudonocardia sp. DLS-67]